VEVEIIGFGYGFYAKIVDYFGLLVNSFVNYAEGEEGDLKVG
jgi:hypothetical protein